MFIGDAILRFSRKSNPEDGLPKELRLIVNLSNSVNYLIQLSAVNPVNISWHGQKIDGTDQTNGVYTGGINYLLNKVAQGQYEFVITGECDSISIKINVPRSITIYEYNLDGLKTIPPFSDWNNTLLGEFPPIWTYNKYKNTEHAGAFTGCTYLTNYNDIPDDWK